MHGRGIMVYNNGDSYTGEWFDGKKHGVGVYKWKNGVFFRGDWIEGKPHFYRLGIFHSYRNMHASIIQKVIRGRASRAAFQTLRAEFLCRCHNILDVNIPRRRLETHVRYRCAYTNVNEIQAFFFATPLVDFIARASCAARYQLAIAHIPIHLRAAFLNFSHLPRAYNPSFSPLLLGGRLSAFSRSELCRTRCGEAVFVARRLTCMSAHARPISFWLSNVVQRVFRGHCKRVRRFFQNRELAGASFDFSTTYPLSGVCTMEEVD